MSTLKSLTEEYHQYLEERKAIAAIGAASAIAIGGAQFLNKDASAAAPSSASADAQDPLWGEGDWAYQPDAVETPTDHPEGEAEAEPEQPAAAVSFNRADLDALSLTLWGEARGEGVDGMRAVAHVIVNRAKHERWSDTVRGVAREDQQFSCWNSDDPNSALMPKMLEFYNYLRAKPRGWQQWYESFKKSPDYSSFQKYLEAREVARNVLQGNDNDNTNGALFYHTGAVSPNWAKGQQIVARVGSHQFYRTDRKA